LRISREFDALSFCELDICPDELSGDRKFASATVDQRCETNPRGAAVIEKLGYVSLLIVFFAQGRIPAVDAQPAWPDLILGVLFIAAFVKTRS